MHFERAESPERTLRRWVDDYLDMVARALRNAGTPPAEVDDAVQRTFIIAARRRDDVRLGAERSFLLQIALNVAAHVRRSAARRREVPESELPERVDAATPEQLTSRKHERQLMNSALEQLSPELRAVFVLFELEERTMAEIAEALQIPPGTVASRLRRAREQLRERLWTLSGRKVAAGALGAGALAQVSSAQAGALLGQVGWLKAIAVAGSATLLVAAPALYWQQRVPTQRSQRLAAASLPARAVVSRHLPVETKGVPAASAEVALAGVAAPASVRPSAPVSKVPAAAEALQAELAQLDAARSRLAAGHAEQALALLRAYERATPRGALRLEAEVLRIDALSRSGRLAQAQQRAKLFLSRHPSSVLAARVRRIVGQ